jgi:hypothetical protein
LLHIFLCGALAMLDFDRRQFLGALSLPVLAGAAPAADKIESAAPKYRLGLVTYNVAAEWDLPTLLKVCTDTGISPVELRTTHKHGVEPTLSKARRKEIKKQFADAGVAIWGCGTTCELPTITPQSFFPPFCLPPAPAPACCLM